jgi:crotonobetainyl-CoA:carnitine CoA-transferase CaiB-like acyl-CoA transferase
MVPAWIGCASDAEPWAAILAAARGRTWRSLVADAEVLGLPVCGVGEVRAQSPQAVLHRRADPGRGGDGPPKVVDLSSLWAGPLCAGLLAQAGAAVTKIESRMRPDPLRTASPAFFARLNGAKHLLTLDFDAPAGRAQLAEAIADADVVVTSARPRAFDQLGLSPTQMFARNPRLTWVAISGYGWTGEGSGRVAFGDDAAAAGGLVRWTRRGEPRFAGDALADPLTGLAAAAGALRALKQGGGYLVDAAMAVTSAGVAARHGCPAAP